MEFITNYSCRAANNEQAKQIADYIHTALVGNEDYIKSSILLHVEDTYINVYVYLNELRRRIPRFLSSGEAFMKFCEEVGQEES